MNQEHLPQTPSNDDQWWMENYKKLEAFLKANEHCDIPPSSGDQALDVWVWNQRWLQQAGWMRQDRDSLFNDLGFFWDRQTIQRQEAAAVAPPPVDWMDKYNKLVDFKQKKGHFRILSAEDSTLNMWVGQQRAQFKLGKLGKAHVELLDKVEFAWEIDAKMGTKDQGPSVPTPTSDQKNPSAGVLNTTTSFKPASASSGSSKIPAVKASADVTMSPVSSHTQTPARFKTRGTITRRKGTPSEAGMPSKYEITKPDQKFAIGMRIEKIFEIEGVSDAFGGRVAAFDLFEDVDGTLKWGYLIHYDDGDREHMGEANVAENLVVMKSKKRAAKSQTVPKISKRLKEVNSSMKDAPAVALKEKTTESVHGLAKTEISGKPESAARTKHVGTNSGSTSTTSTENTPRNKKPRTVSETKATSREEENAKLSYTRDDAWPSRPFEHIKCSPGIPKRAFRRKLTRAKETPAKQPPSYYLGSDSSLSEDSSLYLPAHKPRARGRAVATKKSEGAPSRRPLSYYVDTESSWSDKESLHLSAHKPKVAAPKDEKKENEAKQIQPPEIIDLMDDDDD